MDYAAHVQKKLPIVIGFVLLLTFVVNPLLALIRPRGHALDGSIAQRGKMCIT